MYLEGHLHELGLNHCIFKSFASYSIIQYVPQKSVTLTISENIPKPRRLGVSVQLKKFQNLFCGFGIFSETVVL